MELTEQQKAATDKIERFLRSEDPVFRLLGYAGTGKTSLISQSESRPDYFATPTAKAARVLMSKGVGSARTLHSLLYQPYEYTHPLTEKPTLGFRMNDSSPLQYGGVVVVDEASMVGSGMVSDLLSHPVKVIAVGDPAQLPPVRSKGNESLLSGREDVMLTEIHRSVLDSPIISLSKYVRENGRLPRNNGSKNGSALLQRLSEVGDLFGYDQVIVGTHRTRHSINQLMRDRLGHSEGSLPRPGERIIIKRNHPEYGVVNGDQFTVARFNPTSDVVSALLYDEHTDSTFRLPMWIYGFQGAEGMEKLESMPFKERNSAVEGWFAYAITCHSAQGSEFDHVLVLDESGVFQGSKDKWLYTAVTRASETVTVVRNPRV